MNEYAKIVINSLSNAIDKPFTYKVPSIFKSDILLGHRVMVPFGRGSKLVEGYVMDFLEKNQVDFSYEVKEIKVICETEPLLSENNIKLIKIMREKYLCTYMECIRLFLPTGISKGMTFKKKQILYLIKELDGKYNKEPYIKIVNHVKNEQLERSQLKNLYNLSVSSINTLIKHGFIGLRDEINWRTSQKEYTYYNKKELNSVQRQAVDRILYSEKKQFLIHGVTGSGKTEIYLTLVENMIKNKKESIVLVPEISLTPQMIERFKGRFGESIAIFHSRLSPGERFDQWMRVKNGKVNVAVGARSALFLPFYNLGLIIIDEEHETSYKSDSDPKYNAREISRYISQLNDVKIVLGSATPSLESYNAALKHEMELITLEKRVSDRPLPESIIVDMREELMQDNRSIFSRVLYEGIQERLNKGEQVILFLNRRGFSPFVSCRKCGYVFKCKNCDISLTYHNDGNMVCHYCGYNEKSVTICPKCKSKYVKHFGVGTERVEKEVKKYFKDARVIRMDYDTTRKKDSYELLYNMFKDQKADILIGTQMIAKGLDFENVTLVGILAADLSLNYPDYRASEKTFQLITQVAGRAGRGNKPGEVVIQTYSPDNYSIQYAATNNYIDFFNKEICVREMLNYPPFSKIFLINISSENKDTCSKYISILDKKIKKIVSTYDKINMLGPSPSTIFKLKNEYRWTIIIKGNVDLELSLKLKEIVFETMNENKFKNIKIGMDINPNSFV